MDAKSFGVFIADQRRTLGLTQAEVAARLHVTDKAVSRWERGVGLPDINTLEPLAQVLHLTLDELIHTGTSGTGSGADSVKTFVDLFSPQSRYAGQLLRAVCLLLSILFCLAGLLLCPDSLAICGMSAHRSSLLPTPQSSLSFLLRPCCNVWRYFSGTFVMPIYHFGKRNFWHGSVLFSPGFRNLSGFCAKPCSSSFLAL